MTRMERGGAEAMWQQRRWWPDFTLPQKKACDPGVKFYFLSTSQKRKQLLHKFVWKDPTCKALAEKNQCRPDPLLFSDITSLHNMSEQHPPNSHGLYFNHQPPPFLRAPGKKKDDFHLFVTFSIWGLWLANQNTNPRKAPCVVWTL